MADSPPLAVWLGATIGIAVVGAGLGGFIGITIVDRVKAVEKAQVRVPLGPTPKYGPTINLMELPPIIANLADPPGSWIRLQAAIVYDSKGVEKPQVLAATISSDVLAYLKTMTVAQIGGASGLDHLREDLNERVVIRSDGHVREIIVETLVVQ